MSSSIVVVNARVHNLHDVSVTIPKDKLVVITGPSGSGKSSLAFDTIFVESQRRYIDSLSTYIRQFLRTYDKPDVDSISGLSPSIAISQKGSFKNPRSTIATVTEIYDYMRLLFARIGVPHSPNTGLPLRGYNKGQIIDYVCSLAEGARIKVLSPIVSGNDGKCTRADINKVVHKGFSRIMCGEEVYDLEDYDLENIGTDGRFNAEVLVDRIIISSGCRARVVNSVEIALQLNGDVVYVESIIDDSNSESVISSSRTLVKLNTAIREDGLSIDIIEPRLFSFNSPLGACPQCDGLGKEDFVDPELIIPNKSWTMEDIVDSLDGEHNGGRLSKIVGRKLVSVAKKMQLPMNVPWNAMSSQGIRDAWLLGIDKWPGLLQMVDELSATYPSLRRYIRSHQCSGCNGCRLNRQALCIKIMGLNIGQVSALSISAARGWVASLRDNLSAKDFAIAERIISELLSRISFMENVGLNYLTLNREVTTLSGGEGQRIKLATQIGLGLTNVLYIFDEPSIGLHKFDNERLIGSLLALRDIGNSVILVEHDEDTIRAADHIIDMGPKAGVHGGKIIAQGTLAEIMANPDSVTGKSLREHDFIPVPTRRTAVSEHKISICNTSAHNLKNVSVDFPLKLLTCVTGVSGSGKSTLVMDVLLEAAAKALSDDRRSNVAHGLEYIDRIIEIDQQPIGRTPRSNAATYMGIFDHVRQLFAMVASARARGYKQNRFSFNVPGGRCEECDGDGIKKIEMHFLPDVHVLCEKCRGNRYNSETLEIFYKGKNISEILNMTVVDAMSFFDRVHIIKEKLRALNEVGLGYIKIGQASNTLSGGESQRIKLAKELSKKSTGRTLYILDEPTTGLHACDIQSLLRMLFALVERGNTVVVIEHNMDVIKCADYIIDMGPYGGDKGGNVVATGTPEEVARTEGSVTGKFLIKYLTHQ